MSSPLLQNLLRSPHTPRTSQALPWTSYQKAIFNEVATGTGDALIIARAGSGKTTTVVEAVAHVPPGHRVLVCAFNTVIRDALRRKIRRSPDVQVDVETLHSFGLRVVQMNYIHLAQKKATVEEHRAYTILDAILAKRTGAMLAALTKELPEALPDTEREAIADAAKKQGREGRYALRQLISRSKTLLAKTKKDIMRVAIDASLTCATMTAEEMADVVLVALLEMEELDGTIDFDDMVWLPVALEMGTSPYDYIFVDEAQDLDPCQIKFLQQARRNDTSRLIAVGDPAQAIYGFRGADSNAMWRVVKDAKELSLPVCYRCPTSIIEEVLTHVPDIQARPDAPAGTITDCTMSALYDDARPGDFILSRTNAPLMQTCLGLLRRSVPAIIQGKDIGGRLKAIVQSSKTRDTAALMAWLEGPYRTRETATILRRCPEPTAAAEKIEHLNDRILAIRVLARECASVAAVTKKLIQLFGNYHRNPRSVVMLSTVHRAKGLETDRVWLLMDTFTKLAKFEDQSNLIYVALTRTKDSLFLIHDSATDK